MLCITQRLFLYVFICSATIGVLYSGGIDSLMLALLVDHHIDRGETIDLINVAFMPSKASPSLEESASSLPPDRITAINGLVELRCRAVELEGVCSCFWSRRFFSRHAQPHVRKLKKMACDRIFGDERIFSLHAQPHGGRLKKMACDRFFVDERRFFTASTTAR